MAKAGELPAAGERVTVYEVGPRDGLQNEAQVLGTKQKLELILALSRAGLQRIEVSSFVRASWIPQLADAEDVFGELGKLSKWPGEQRRAEDSGQFPVTAAARPVLSGLVPNLKGLERALSQQALDTVAVFLSASDTHNRKNVNRSIEESLAGFAEVIPQAKAAGKQVRAYVSTVWGCPFEGKVPISRSLEIATRLVELGADQISLGDTIGVGTPSMTHEICRSFLQEIPAEYLALHMHDTWGMALANVLVGLELGIRTFDSSIGGLGGCPYAPGAAGNLASEDLVYMLHGMGLQTGVEWEALVDAGLLAERLVGRQLSSKALKAAAAGRKA